MFDVINSPIKNRGFLFHVLYFFYFYTNQNIKKMEVKFSTPEQMHRNIYIRAFKNFKIKHPEIDFDTMVNEAIEENNVLDFYELSVATWMDLNIKMIQLIEKVKPTPTWDHSNNDWKSGWIEEIRRTTPRNKFGFGND